ncbi:MAG: pyruvate kinase [Pseudomonadota bacterium]
MKRNRRAKIVATVGPASNTPEKLRQLFHAGVDVFRLNFSHGTQDDHAKVYEAIRGLERESGRPIAVLQDLQGPKIRLGTLKDGKLMLEAGDTIRFVLDGTEGDKTCVPLPHASVIEAIAPGHPILIDDGKVRLETVACGGDYIEAVVRVPGPISNRKGVNLPATALQLSPLTDKDRADLEFGLELGVDWVALSFVQRPSDIIEARQIVGNRAKLMAKIEKPSALESIDEIVALVDSIMVARGDLGVEIPPEEVPGRQKQLIRACRLAAKPVVIATQMLESMITNPSPTRAEASDVATAVYDGASAVMLSAESAAGQYPVEAVTMMDRIVRRTERDESYRSIIAALQPDLEMSAPHAVSAAAADVADAIHATAIVAFTSSGTTAARISRKRAAVPIVAMTPNLQVARQMSLFWGVHSVTSEEIASYTEMVQRGIEGATAEGFAGPRDMIVVIAGIPFGIEGSTNNLRVVTV